MNEAGLPRDKGQYHCLKEAGLPHSKGRGQDLKEAELPRSMGQGHGSRGRGYSSSVRRRSVHPRVYSESQPDTGPRSNGTTSPCCTAATYSHESWRNDD